LTRLGMIGMARHIAANEGVTALYKGFWPAIHRQLVFASLRVGLYGQISSYFKKPGQDTVPLSSKVMAGLASGAIGITVANPTDLVKVRFQSEGKLAPGQKPRYTGVINAYSTIVKQEGLLGLWTGLGPAIARNSIINATELVTYDTAKHWLLSPAVGMKDGFLTHFSAAAMAGGMATLVGNPVDVVKTRVMAAAKGASTGVTPQYTGAFDCAIKTLKQEGPLAFYQGVGPQFFRITGWNIVMFVSLEQIKKQASKAFAANASNKDNSS
jgi:solute carrier family 25 (mitochondrial uncoupling protein), member 8/9